MSITGGKVYNGFADYNDTATTATPIALSNGVWTTITNDGLGTATNLNYLPSGVTSLMDTTTGKLDFSELSLGDTVLIRNDYTIDQDQNNSLLEFRYTLGTGAGAYTLEKKVARLDSGTSQLYRFSLKADLIYMGDENTRDNPVTMQVRLDASGTLVNSGSAISVIKR